MSFENINTEGRYESIVTSTVESGTKKYDIRPQSVQEFLSSDSSLKIPDYQRPYSWESSHVQRFFDDIQNSRMNDKAWFIGPVFTNAQRSDNDSILEVLDGQQRVTTLQLVLRELAVIDCCFDTPVRVSAETRQKYNRLKQIIHTCLVRTTPGGRTVAKFSADVATRNLLSKYLVEVITIDAHEQWKSSYTDFMVSLNEDDKQWNLTIRNIKSRVTQIREYLCSIMGNEHLTIKERFDEILAFGHTLLFNFWLIQIPLTQTNHVYDIFESLNNRGKRLTLVDVIKFRSIVILERHKNQANRLWISIHRYCLELEELKVFDSEVDFFKVLLNTYASNKNGITRTDQFIQEFEKHCLNEDELLAFLEEASSVARFFLDIERPFDSGNSILSSFTSNRKQKPRALLQLLRFAIKCSDNFRYVVAYASRAIEEELRIEFLFNAIRALIHLESFQNLSSNKIRPFCIGLIQYMREENSDIEDFLKENALNKIDLNLHLYNALCHTNSNKSNFILCFIQFVDDYSILSTGSPDQYKIVNSEHIWPIKWKEHWTSQVYSSQEVNTWLDDNKDFLNQTFGSDCATILSSQIKGRGNAIELRDYSDDSKKRDSQDNSLIQFLGNKWAITAPDNASLGNKSFRDKKRKLNEKAAIWISIPSNNGKFGLSQTVHFNYDVVLRRSCELLAFLVDNFNISYSDIQSNQRRPRV